MRLNIIPQNGNHFLLLDSTNIKLHFSKYNQNKCKIEKRKQNKLKSI